MPARSEKRDVSGSDSAARGGEGNVQEEKERI